LKILRLLQNSESRKKLSFLLGNPGEGRGRPGMQDFLSILDSGFAGMTLQEAQLK
jgi:hypothetical protein